MGLQDGTAYENEFGTNHVPTSVTIHSNRARIIMNLTPKEAAKALVKENRFYAKKLFKALKKELR